MPAVPTASSPASALSSGPSTNRQYAKSEKDVPAVLTQDKPKLPHTKSIPTPRSQTPASGSRSRSTTHTPEGSPPLFATALTSDYAVPPASKPPNEYFPPPTSSPRAQPGDSREQGRTQPLRHEDSASIPTSHPSPRPTPPRGPTRSTSMGGGIQVVLNEQGSWSDMAHQSRGLVTTPTDERRVERPSGIIGFLSRKKGRDRSPKPKEKERGVLGKDGARVILSSG